MMLDVPIEDSHFCPNTGEIELAQVLARWGEIDAATQSLDRARDIGDPGASRIVAGPVIDPLRKDLRFVRLMAKVRLS